MASGKEIRNKIKSVESTRKITKAMEMVAASKMRKAQDRMRAARPYGEKIRRVAGNLSHALTDYSHPFLVTREQIKSVGLIAVTSDKGLCGGLNTNVLRLALGRMKEWDAEGKKLQVTAIGNRGFSFMMRAITIPESPAAAGTSKGKKVCVKDKMAKIATMAVKKAFIVFAQPLKTEMRNMNVGRVRTKNKPARGNRQADRYKKTTSKSRQNPPLMVSKFDVDKN